MTKTSVAFCPRVPYSEYCARGRVIDLLRWNSYVSHRHLVHSANCILEPLDPTSIGVLSLDHVLRVEFLNL